MIMFSYRKRRAHALISCMLALALVWTSAWPAAGAQIRTAEAQPAQAQSGPEVFCNVKYSRPAICCDMGQRVDLTGCGVQFAADSGMVTEGLTWTYSGKTVTSFTPPARGVYPLTVTASGQSKTVYIVAKSPEETEYVLYRNDFNEAPSDFRVAEQNGGISVRDGSYILDASQGRIQVLLPEFLDDFGDATVKAGMKMTGSSEAALSALMFRVQSGGDDCYQGVLRPDATAPNGVELAGKNEIYQQTAFANAYSEDYNLYTVTARGTYSTFSVNSCQLLEYANTAFASGGFGFRADGTTLAVDYVQVSLEGNDPVYAACDVSFGKPVIRADMGDTVDLKSCDVQFIADTVYADGSGITWKKDGQVLTVFTPSAPGVTELTAHWAGHTRKVYVVTRSLTEGEYILYRNDFDTAPEDFRVIQRSGSSAYHDGKGHYVLNASTEGGSARVLLPEFLDEFENFKLEAGCKELNPRGSESWSALTVRVDDEQTGQLSVSTRDAVKAEPRARSAGASDGFNTYELTVQNNSVTGQINGQTVLSGEEQPQVTGGMGLQAQGVTMTVDYVQVSLGATTAAMDTSVKCYVAKSRPAIGCDAGQTVLLSQCPVQFTYGSYAVPGDQVTWKKDGQIITEFSATSVGIHTLTATHGHTTMNVYVVAKKSGANEYVLYGNEFYTGPTDYRVAEASGGATVYPIDGTFVLDGSAGANAYARVYLPVFLDQFGDMNLEASIKLTKPVDNSKWASVVFRAQNTTAPYMQCCLRNNPTVSNGVEISQRTKLNTWNVLHQGSTGVYHVGGYNVVNVIVQNLTTTFKINGATVLQGTDTPDYNGSWGFQVRGVTLTIDYVRAFFKSNYGAGDLYALPGGYVDVRDPSTGISAAPSMITEVKTRAEYDNILTDCPAVAILNYEVEDGYAKIVFSDGAVSPDEALDKLCSKVIPAFRISSEAAADSLASLLQGRNIRDAYAVSSELFLLKRAYGQWQYIRGVADYSAQTNFDPETLRYDAWANKARVLLMPENTSRDAITKLQDSYACVWLKVSEGKTATVAGINKGPYGLVTPDRSVTEYCYKNYYGANTLVRRTNIIGHRGALNLAPENTILGTQTAYNNGADMVENDIYLTTDGVVVVMHDETLDRTTNGTGNVVDKSSAQLKKYSVDYYPGVAAQPIPTLEDYFKLIKGNSNQKLVIEMKHPYDARLANAMVALIQKYDILDQVVIMSFLQANVANTTAALPGAPVGILSWLEMSEDNPMYATYQVMEQVQPYHSVCNPGYSGWGSKVIKEVAHRGVTLWPWTVNDRSQFDSLFINGVAGITTDYCQWSKNYIESLHWNSSSRVISSTYNGVLTDVTNSCEVVVVEDTLGITCSAGNITVPQPAEGGMATLYYRYKHTTGSGQTYYTVTELRTIVIPTTHTFTLKNSSRLALSRSRLTKVTDQYTVAALKNQFQYPVEVLDQQGNLLGDTAWVTTGSVVRLKADPSQKATVVILGDVNGDGSVDTTDYMRIRKSFLQEYLFEEPFRTAADCNGDGCIDTTDYMIIRYHVLKISDLFARSA